MNIFSHSFLAIILLIHATTNITATYAFGDSILDPGNDNRLSTITRRDRPTYGRDFLGHFLAERFSNIRLITDLIVRQLGLKAAKVKEAPAEKPILGGFSSHLKMAIVGLPNVGKSTLFNTLTNLSIPAENFPFCTIEPNVALVNVPDELFEWLHQLYMPKNEVSAFLEIYDVAGLVRGAHAGQGLGNSFLSEIRAVDGIFHVLRAFEDPDIINVEDTVDPVRNLEVITEELRLKDLKFMERRIEDLEKSIKRSNDKLLKIEHELCLRVKAFIEEGKDVRLGDWKAADIEILNSFQLMSAKPVVYLVNMNEKDYQCKKNKFLPKIHAWVQEHGGGTTIPFSGVLERNLADMPSDKAAKYCEENKVQSALPKIIKTGFGNY